MKKRRLQFGGNVNETVPASRQNIDQRTPSGVRPVGSPVIPVKSDVQGAMKHGGELKKMSRSVKRMAVGGVPGPMGPGGGRGRGGPGQGSKGPAPGGMRGPGRGDPGQGKGGSPGQGQGKGGAPGDQGQGKGPVPGGFMGGGAGQDQGMGPGGKDMRYPMGPGSGGMPMFVPGGDPEMRRQFMEQNAAARARMSGMGPGALGPQGLPNPNMNPNMGRAPGMKKGGKVSASSYRDMTGGAAGGIGRLEKSSIAAKTKSQKLKVGGKVRGYAEGKKVVADDNRSFESVFADARRAKADEFEWRGKKYTTKVSDGPSPKDIARKAMETPRNAGGGPRGNPSTGSDAQMRSMNLYPFGTDSNSVDTLRDEQYAKDNRGKGGGRGGKRNVDDGGRAAALREMGIPEGSPLSRDTGGIFGAATDNSPSSPYANPKMGAAMEESRAKRANAPRTDFSVKQSAAIDKMIDVARRNNNQKEVDRLTALKDKKGMKKGGKVEAFEGTRKDMAQDKKLAKKRGMSLKAWEKSSADTKHDTQQNMKGLKKGGAAKYAMGGKVSTSQTGMKTPLRPKPSAMAMGGYAKGGKTEAHMKGCKCMACGGMAKMAKGGKVGMTFGKPLPGTKVSSQKIRSTVSTDGANMKKDGMKGQLRAKASGAKTTAMMKPLGMTKMAKGGKVRGAGIAQRGTKFIGEV